jgi:hypothetical protein
MIDARLYLNGALTVADPKRLAVTLAEGRWTVRLEGPLVELFDMADFDRMREQEANVVCTLLFGGVLLMGETAPSNLVREGRQIRVSFTPTSTT